MKVDLHLHSKYSWDSVVEIENYISRAEMLGFGAISIADHNNTESHTIITSLQEETDVILVPGQEVTTLDGHLLVYGYLPTVPAGLTMTEAVEFAKQKNNKAICIAAHAFDFLRGGKGKRVLSTGIDGIEGQNASAIFGYFNYRAKKHCSNVKICTGNSDSHRLEEFGTAYTEIPEATSFEEVLHNLDRGIPKGGRIGLWRKTNRFIRRVLR